MSDFRQYAGVDFSAEFLVHYGVGHEKGGHSGRYKWGSGDRPYQRTSMEGKGGQDNDRPKRTRLSGTSGSYPWGGRDVDARVGKSTLNKEDKRQAKLTVKLQEANRKYQKAANKRGVNDEKTKKLEANLEGILREYQDSVQKTNDTIKRLTEQGFTVDSKEIRRLTMSGKQLALAAISALGPVGIVSFNSVRGRKYKVKDNQDEFRDEVDPELARLVKAREDAYVENTIRNSSKTEREYERAKKAVEEYYKKDGNSGDAVAAVKPGKTPAQQSLERHKQFVNEQQKYKLTDAQQEHYNDAKTKDRWDMTFLEMYQPDTWNAAKALREYKAYLLDPEEWIKDH